MNRQKITIILLLIFNICLFVSLVLKYKSRIYQENVNFSQNKTTLEIYKIYQRIDSLGYFKCHDFSSYQMDNSFCGESVCDCVKNTIDVFKNHCLEYTRNIVDSFSECFLVANTINGCSDIFCKL